MEPAAYLRVDLREDRTSFLVCVAVNTAHRAAAYLTSFLTHHYGREFTVTPTELADEALVPICRHHAKRLHEDYFRRYGEPDRNLLQAVSAFFTDLISNGHARELRDH